MHGYDSPSALLVNAEVDSMGGVVEGGVGIACKTSPRRAAIERIQGELRQEYNVRDKRKRELEFLEKGGNPLDLLKPGDATSVSVQSTSFTNQHQDHFITSEAKGSFAFTASPHGDSVESSGRLGANPCEPNSADNLMLFDGEHEFSEGDRNSLHPSRSKTLPSEKVNQMDGSHRNREHEAAAFSVPRKAYKRRNRSRPNREGIRLSSVDVNTTHGSDGSSLPSRQGKDLIGLISDTENRKPAMNCDSKPVCAKDGGESETGLVDTHQDLELGGGNAVQSSDNLPKYVPVQAASDAVASEMPLNDQCNQQSLSGALETPNQTTIDGSEAILTVQEMSSAVVNHQQSGASNKTEDDPISCQINGISSEKDGTKYDARNIMDPVKVLDSESSCAQSSKSINGNNDGEMCKKMTNADSNGRIKDQDLPLEERPLVECDEFVIEKRETVGVGNCAVDIPESSSACPMQQDSVSKQKRDEELNKSESATENEVKSQIAIEAIEPFEPSGPESGTKTHPALDGNPEQHDEIPCTAKNQNSIDTSSSDIPTDGSLTIKTTVSLEAKTSPCSDSKVQPEIDEESILKEAQIIEAKRRRIAELSAVTSVRKICPKSHWDYVLEEMAWLANDFAQERVWKIAASAQISSRAAFTCRLRKHKNSSHMEAKIVAQKLAKSVMEFWHSVEAKSILTKPESQRGNAVLVAYAVRFLKHNNFNVVDNQAAVPMSPDRVSDLGILDLSWEDNLTEENLFYSVPPGAMETFKLSIKSQVAQFEKLGNSAQEEVETSACDGTTDFESQDTAYDEDEGEISPYDRPMAFDNSKSSRFSQMKRKHLIHAHRVRSYEATSDTLPMQYAENKVFNQQSTLMAKRPGGSLNVSIPTKRVRTASRRVISPFSVGTSGCIQVPNKTDASSGDTNSFQDDQMTPRDGSLVQHSLEVDSGGDFSKQLPYHSAEMVTKHKKKKKPKHLNAAYESRWQVDTTFQMEQLQRDNLKKSRQLESNGNNGLFGQPMIKKPKIMRPSQDNSFENPVSGSAPSPAASQMSNMSNSNKFIKMLGGRDRGRKPKLLKMPTGQLGSGSPWTLFEDQALVVLAHDLGPNWELVSDAINSTLQFKCIFRKAKECKERHNFLMDRTSGDGADSAEDSGSSQPYPSTLPGIPRGSARQLFQRLQGPMEEETLKSHFEKIIVIGQKQQYRKNQNDNQDPKQLQQPHGSHTVALSQVCPNNLNGGPILTPLDICDATIAVPDILPIGYQGPHPGGLAIANQGLATPMHPASGVGSALQGSPNMMLGNNFSSSPGSLNSTMRDGRYGVPRPTSVDEQQRMQQYNHMMTNRNTPQSNPSPSGALPGNDRGGRMLPSGNGMGLVGNVNRSIPMSRPGFQGVASSSMVNSGNMVSPAISSPNMHSGVGSGQGSSVLRPREPIHMMRPGLSQDSQRQMMAPDLQMQASPGNSQVPHFGGPSSPFPTQTASPPVSSYPLHHQPSHPISPQQPQVHSPHHPHFQGSTNHAPNPQQQAYAIRLAKERQHRLLQQQQHPVQPQQHPVQPQQPQFAPSISLVPHAQSQSQLPISPTVQNSSQVQPQTATPPVSHSTMTSVSSTPQHQQKHQMSGQGAVRNAQAGGTGLTNQSGKQRQRQLSQANRQHPQQRQQAAKVAKGVGRGSLMMNQNISVDPSLVNGVSTSSGNQSSDKGDTPSHLMSGQSSFANSGLSTVQPTGQYASPRPPHQSLTQQKSYPAQAASSTKQGHVPAVPPGSNHQQMSNQKLMNQNQSALQRLQPNCQIISDPSKPPAINSDAGQHPASSSAEMFGTTTLPQTTSSATDVAKVVSSAKPHQLLDAHPTDTGESATQVGQELGQRPLATLPSSNHNVSAQFQKHHQSSQLPHPNSPVSQHQQPLHSQQGQLLQAGKSNLYGRPSDHSLE